MKHLRNNGGFTLVELMVTILVASIVTLSATTLLLLGIRIMHKSNDTAEKQQATRVLLTALEDLAAEGTITEIRTVEDAEGLEVWQVRNGTKVVFSYSEATKSVYTGAPEDNAPLLDHVESFSAELTDNVLTFIVKAEGQENPYETSIYCRMAPDYFNRENPGADMVDQLAGGQDVVTGEGFGTQGRNAFLKMLASQYRSRGVIMGPEFADAGKYYSEWYIGGYGDENPGWNRNTPWCACFVSWALSQESVYKWLNAEGNHTIDKWFAHVDQPESSENHVPNFKSYFKTELGTWHDDIAGMTSGDLVFFNTDEDANADHMGVVLAVQDGKVYTIEGNSFNQVRVRNYELDDANNGIVGYGVLNWQ